MPDAQRRCYRVSDRYIWVCGYVTLAHLEIAARQQPDLVIPLAPAVASHVVNPALQETAAALSNRVKGGR
jgi:hypothetical protein